MWVIHGPFDGANTGDVGFQKPKLLKPSTSYVVGRKERPLLINNKKISHDHCAFEVETHGVDQVGNPSLIPALNFVNLNKKDKGMTIKRGGKSIDVQPTYSEPLKTGDKVTLISGVDVSVEWMPICAYSDARKGFSVDACAALGIKLVHKPAPEVTHHITTEYTADLSSSATLLGVAKFVKPEWLQEVLRIGDKLQEHFLLPSDLLPKYRPAFSSSLAPSQKEAKIWQPSEEREHFFQTCRFICLHEKVTAKDTDLRDAVHRGEGTLENFDVHSGVGKFRKALARSIAKDGKKTVVVGDGEAMRAAVGEEVWSEFVEVSQSSSLNINSPAQFVEAVLAVNLGILLGTNGMDLDEPSTSGLVQSPISNTLSREMSVEPDAAASQPTRTRLTRRVTSRAASREPSVAPMVVESEPEKQDDEPPLRPRRALTRRAVVTKPIITGIDDASSIIDAVPDLTGVRGTPPPPEFVDLTAPTPARSTRLKRRFGAIKETGAGASSTQMSAIEETAPEPATKKFRALFESGNNQDSATLESFDPLLGGGGGGSSSQTQTETETQGGPSGSGRAIRGMGDSSLAVLREEEEETQATPGTGVGFRGRSQVDSEGSLRGAKRRLESEEDVEMQVTQADSGTSADGGGDGSASGPPVSKKRAVEGLNSVDRVHHPGTSKPSSMAGARTTTVKGKENDKQGTGALPGKPDTDPTFLKAIASTKRGKKTEDAFDREFNKLKISKPELDQQQDPEEEWGVLAEFGDDSGLRGNFMVVVEMDVYRKDGAGNEVLAQKVVNDSWDGKPNFKKFKKKVAGYERTKVDLFATEDNDYGIGNAYWKGGHSQMQSQTQNRAIESQDSQVDEEIRPPPRQRKGRAKAVPESDDEDAQAPPPTRRASSRKPSSRVGSVAPSTASKGKAKAKPKADPNALFLDSDDDIQEVHEVEDISAFADARDEEETLKSTPEERRRGTGSRPTKATSKAATKPKKAAPIIVDDDSDDGAVFKGFKGKRGGR